MTTKESPKYALLEELKQKSELALAIPEIVEVVKNAPINKAGKVNLSHVEREARKFSLEQRVGLKTSEEVARSARFLAMMKRDYEREFGEIIAEAKNKRGASVEEDNTPKRTKGKTFTEMEFELPRGALELITRKFIPRSSIYDANRVIEAISIRFGPGHEDFKDALKLCEDILVGAWEGSPRVELHGGDIWPHKHMKIRLAELLEEKFGMKVRTCQNCKWFRKNPYFPEAFKSDFASFEGWCTKHKRDSTLGGIFVNLGSSCMGNPITQRGLTVEDAWEPKVFGEEDKESKDEKEETLFEKVKPAPFRRGWIKG